MHCCQFNSVHFSSGCLQSSFLCWKFCENSKGRNWWVHHILTYTFWKAFSIKQFRFIIAETFQETSWESASFFLWIQIQMNKQSFWAKLNMIKKSNTFRCLSQVFKIQNSIEYIVVLPLGQPTFFPVYLSSCFFLPF